MVIAVNTRFLVKDGLDGYSAFIHELFSRITTQYPEHQFYFLFDRPYDPQLVFSSNVTPLVVSPPARHPLLWKWWFDVKVPRVLKKVGADVFVSPDGFCSLTTRVPQCLVVHDLGFLHNPQDYKKNHLFFYKQYTSKFLKKATQVIAVTTVLKQELISTYKTDEAKIAVVYNGVKDVFQPTTFEQQRAVKETYTDGQEYFIYAGAIHPRKNLINLLKAFSRFKKRQKSSMKLVLAGRLAWKNDVFLNLLKTYKYRRDVVLLDAITTETELAQLVAAAYALVYPSFYERFDVPVAEAMRCGVPVLTAKDPILQEITGGQALCFDPTDVPGIAEQMMRIYKDETLREQLIVAAKAVAQHYTWDAAATALWQCIESAVTP
jgi:glycosyltransferase involved in cell wall biosynthesis